MCSRVFEGRAAEVSVSDLHVVAVVHGTANCFVAQHQQQSFAELAANTRGQVGAAYLRSLSTQSYRVSKQRVHTLVDAARRCQDRTWFRFLLSYVCNWTHSRSSARTTALHAVLQPMDPRSRGESRLQQPHRHRQLATTARLSHRCRLCQCDHLPTPPDLHAPRRQQSMCRRV